MALSSTKLDSAPDFKVLVQNRAGEFLAGGPDKWFFTRDRLHAIVFHYEADHVAEQLETLRVKYGIALEAVPVPLEEVYEACDLCRELFVPFMIFFDGKRFLCADCRARRKSLTTKISASGKHHGSSSKKQGRGS